MDDTKEDKALKSVAQQGAESVHIPIGSADVKEMIAQKLYADKTAYITKLFRTNGIYYFFTRPRRFGKSLLLDTINQIAQGNKALFKECAIYADQTYKWKKYPVIWLNFSEVAKGNPEKLENNLIDVLYTFAQNHTIDRSSIDPIIGEPTVEGTLGKLIDALKKLGDGYEPQPIILIDEYDSPLISCKKEQYEEVLSVLSSFFKVLKARQKECKFIFVTGVTKFHLSGLISGANSANDISLHEDYAGMLGYTEEDIDKLFLSKETIIHPVLEKLNRKKTQEAKHTLIEVKRALKDYYNGYCFTADKMISVYNPDSILKFFYEKDFGNYWSNSGNPTILLKQIQQNIYRFDMNWQKDSFPIKKNEFKNLACSIHEMPLLPLMYQTGYLTMNLDPVTDPVEDKCIDVLDDAHNTTYYLKFPNGEVQSSLKLTLSRFIAQKQQETGKTCSASILASLRKEAWVAFLNLIRSACLAKAGYRFLDKTERSFQGALYSFLNGAFHATHDTWASAERDSGIGRTDIVMEDQYNAQSTVYIFELKVDKPALYALEQIHNKDYSIQYDLCYKKVLIGLKYDPVKLNITEAAIEVHQRDEVHTFQVMPCKNFTVNASGYFQEVG
ncbi:AAA family ATPase [Cardinium endosymbiont of Nabis limbatus]|uniref:AAA family ATPase n=1 Tax=Cardinium endosymbiont of Nabis limbatus TaxID=3066217 RepID=UPI003AF349CD